MRRLLLPFVLVACGGPEPAPADVTFCDDIVPVMKDTCWRCHNPDGVGYLEGRGDFSTYETAAPYAWAMAQQVEEQSRAQMPPPASDPECRPYHGSQTMTLSDERRALFRAWASQGAVKGDGECDFELPEDPAYDPTLPENVQVLPAATYDVDPADLHDKNKYWCRIIPVDEPLYIHGLYPHLDAPSVLHHFILFQAPDLRNGKRPGEATYADWSEEGFECEEPIMEDGWEFLHTWAPGMERTEFPEGKALVVEADHDLVLQVHYFHEGDDVVPDRSGYVLNTLPQRPAIEDQLMMLALGPLEFSAAEQGNSPIPAGARHTVSWDWTWDDPGGIDRVPQNVFDALAAQGVTGLSIYGMWPHMHLLGDTYSAELRKSDGSTSCLLDGIWTFESQPVYLFEEPVPYEFGDTVHFDCNYDNTPNNPEAVDHEVGFGEGTRDEMCFILPYVGALQ